MTLADGHEGQKGQKSGIEPVVSTTMPTIVSFAAERDSLIRNGEFTMFIREDAPALERFISMLHNLSVRLWLMLL